jgi:hypothetical protein
MRGQCLCGAISFELVGEIPNLYQCHCSLCRKVTGSSANAALRVGRDQLNWSSGAELVGEYQTDTGFKSHFCSRCGSPLPNLTAQDTAWWVPVGLLEESDRLQVGAHLFVDSRASWDLVPESGLHFEAMPDADELARLLRRESRDG